MSRTWPSSACPVADVHQQERNIASRGLSQFEIHRFPCTLAGHAYYDVVAAVLIHLLTYVLFRYFESREGRRVTPEYPLAAAQTNRVPPEPRLQTDPREDLREMREQEDAVLESYGWVDRNAGVVRIPIDEAIKLTLKRGAAVRREGPDIATASAVSPAPGSAAGPPGGELRGELPGSPSSVLNVTAPFVGIFYRAAKPGAPPYIEVGSQVEEDTIIGIIEVMKLMNTVRAEVRGTVVEILVQDGAVVEYAQVLVRIARGPEHG